jgi:uncharacterized membrane protein YdfJ with MMPL/SSD domain
MRRRLVAIGLGVLGLGIPFIVAWLARRDDLAAHRAAEPAGEGGAPTAAGSPMIGAPGPALPDPAAPTAPPPVGMNGHVLEPHPKGVFAAVGRFDYRFRRFLPILGLAILLGANLWAAADGGTLIQGGWVIPGSQEQQASALLANRFGEQATTMIIIYTDPQGNATSTAFQDEIAASLTAVEKDPAVTRVVTYATAPSTDLISKDGTSALAVIYLDKAVESAVTDASRISAEIAPPAGVQTQITGVPLLYHQFNQKIEHDLIQAEVISLPIALLILLAVFGTLVAAGLPLLMAGFALPTAFAVIRIVAGFTDMSVFVNNLASMIGLALAIDYSLFMVSRFREELRHHSVEIAVERMMGSVGKAVAVSGVAVAIGLSALAVFPAAALRSMGYAGFITVISTLVFALTVLPAILSMLGPRVNRLRLPMPARLRLIEDDPEAAERRHGRGIWAWIAARVMRRPFLVAIPVLGVLILAGSPFLSLQLSTGQTLTDLPNTPARAGFETIIADFPGGENDPITVAVTWPSDTGSSLDAAMQQSLAAYVAKLQQISGVAEVQSVLQAPPGIAQEQYAQLLALPPDQRPPQVAAQLNPYIDSLLARDTTKVTVFSTLLSDSDAGRALVSQVRSTTPPGGATVLTAGLSSRSLDFMTAFDHAVPIAIVIVVLVTGGVLFLTFGSVFLPIKAVLMSLISISASFGALVWIFQEGHLSNVLGFEATHAVAAWIPLIMFAILFGLSMDYEVLLLSRIRERYLATGDNTRAVAEGIGITGGIITGAALIMVAVFAAFGMSSITFIKALGLMMALAVLIDATLVRGLLVPAFMRVMGWVNWWAPRWVQRAIARLGLYEQSDAERARVRGNRVGVGAAGR